MSWPRASLLVLCLASGTLTVVVALMSDMWHPWNSDIPEIWSVGACGATMPPGSRALAHQQLCAWDTSTCGAAMELGTRTRAFAEDSGSGVQVHLQWLQCLRYRYLQGSCRSGVWTPGKHSVVTKLGSETWAYMEHPWLWGQGHVWVWGWGTDSPDSRAVEQQLLMREVQQHVSLQWSTVATIIGYLSHTSCWCLCGAGFWGLHWQTGSSFVKAVESLLYRLFRFSVARVARVFHRAGHCSKWWHLLCGWYWYLLPLFVPSLLEMSQISQPSQWFFSCGYSVFLLHCVAVGF